MAILLDSRHLAASDVGVRVGALDPAPPVRIRDGRLRKLLNQRGARNRRPGVLCRRNPPPPQHHGCVEILLWLLPTVVVTVIAMGVAGWVGRERPEREATQADKDRFAEAIMRPLPATARTRPQERSNGVAVRRTQARTETSTETRTETRRSA